MAESGDRVERLRARGGRLELVGEHVARLLGVAAARAAALPPPPFEAELQRTFDPSGRRNGVLELRRSASGELSGSELHDPDFGGERLAEGLRLLLAGERPALPATKESATAVRARELLLQAATHGADELLWTRDGALVGATTLNLFLVRGATLVTPSLASGAWPGILRRAVAIAARQLAPTFGLTVGEERLFPADLARADDAFLASSAHGIVAISSLDGRPLPPPPRGSLARTLVPMLRLRVHELCRDRFLPAE